VCYNGSTLTVAEYRDFYVLNILFIKKLYSPIGGSEAMTYQLATRLADRGHRVRVLSLWQHPQRYQFPPPGSLIDEGEQYRLYLDAGVEICQLRPRYGQIGNFLDVLSPFNLLRRSVARELAQGFEVIHNVCREYAEASLQLADELGAKLIMTPLAHPGQAWGGAGQADIARYRRADAVVALTTVEREWYLARGVAPERVKVIGLGPSIDGPGDGKAFRQEHAIDGPMVLFVGRKERYKGVDTLLAATPLVWRHHPRTHFAFVGEAPWYDWLWGSFRHRGDSRIVNLPVVDEQTKANAFAACDVFCLPSRHETFGLVYAEAWLCAKPVIGVDIPPLREVISDGVDGLIVHQRAQEIASAIGRLLANPVQARRMGLAGRRKVEERYAWHHIVKQTEQLYSSLLHKHVPPLDLAI
jgi:glycosyltransferase involved in cell wall biosynthesis